MAADWDRTPPAVDSKYGKMVTVIYRELFSCAKLKRVSLSDVLENVSKELQQHGGDGQEISVDRDLLKKILVAGIMVKLNLYKMCSYRDKMRVIEILTKLEENQQLNLVSYNYLGNLLQKMDFTEFKRYVFPFIKSTLSTSWADQTLATLHLLTLVEGTFPDCVPANFLENNLGTSDILCLESLDYLCQILRKNPKASSKHPIFEVLIKKLSASNLVEQFFTKLDLVMRFIDRREYITFTTLLSGVLRNTNNAEVIPNILTRNYLGHIVGMVIPMDETLYEECHYLTGELFDVLVCSLKNKPTNSKIVINVLKKLLFIGGCLSVKSAYSNAVQTLVGLLTVGEIKELGEILKDIVVTEAISQVHISEMENITTFLMALKDYSVMHDEREWRIELLTFVAKIGLLENQSGVIPDYVADSFKEDFFASFHTEMSQYKDFGNIISEILNEFIPAINGDNPDVVRTPLRRKAQQTWHKAIETITSLNGSTHDRDIVFRYLCSLFCIELLNDPELASRCLSQVFSCYESTQSRIDSEDEIIWFEIVDLIVNLLSYDCWFMPDLINHVFSIVCKYIDSTMLHQILYQLDPDISSIPAPSPDESADEDSDLSDYEGEGWDFPEEDSDSDDQDDTSESGNNNNEQYTTEYRIRLLSLIETYLKNNPSMLLTLEIMSSLMRLLQFCVKAGAPEELTETVRDCLEQLPFLQLNESKDVTEEFLIELLTEIFYNLKLEPALVQQMSKTIVDCSIYVLTCSQHLNIVAVENSENVQKTNLHEVMQEVVRVSFVTDSDILYDVLKKLFKRSWKRVHVFSLLPIVLPFVFHKYNCQRRHRALKLAKIFFQKRQHVASHLEEMKTIEKDIVGFLGVCVDFFRELGGKPTERNFRITSAFLLDDNEIYLWKWRQKSAKDKFTCDLLQLLCDIETSGLGRMFQIWPILTSEARHCSGLNLSQDVLEALGKFRGESFAGRAVRMWKKTTYYIVEVCRLVLTFCILTGISTVAGIALIFLICII